MPVVAARGIAFFLPSLLQLMMPKAARIGIVPDDR